jgi:hypothetical protein
MDLFLDMIVPDGGEMFCKAGVAGLARLDTVDEARILSGFLMSEVEIVPVMGECAVSASLSIEGTGAFFLGRKVLKTGKVRFVVSRVPKCEGPGAPAEH